jgi:HAD superfamily hydrolase (TIGR01509 family)
VNDIQEKEGVCDTLRALKKRGAELNVLTASPHLALDPCLKRLGVWELFSNVWSCDDFGTTKADPEIYRMAAERIGAAVEDVVFVDDNVNAVKTARKAGMRVYGIYDKSSDEFVDEMKKVSEKYLNKLSELL